MRMLVAFIVLAITVGLYAFFRAAGLDFALGAIFMACLYQVGHYCTYGTWIEF